MCSPCLTPEFFFQRERAWTSASYSSEYFYHFHRTRMSLHVALRHLNGNQEQRLGRWAKRANAGKMSPQSGGSGALRSNCSGQNTEATCKWIYTTCGMSPLLFRLLSLQSAYHLWWPPIALHGLCHKIDTCQLRTKLRERRCCHTLM